MKIFPHSIVAANSFDQFGDLLLHDQESNLIATIEQLGCIALCNKETLKKESNHHSHEPLLDCTSHWRLGFEALKIDGRHLGVRNLFSLQDDTFSMSSSQLKGELLLSDPRPHWFWKTMDGREVSRRDFIRDALRHTMECNAFLPFSQEQIEDRGHIRMDNISHACVGHPLSHTHHDWRFLPTTYLILDRVSLILEKLTLQNPIKCKDRNFIWEDGPSWEEYLSLIHI